MGWSHIIVPVCQKLFLLVHYNIYIYTIHTHIQFSPSLLSFSSLIIDGPSNNILIFLFTCINHQTMDKRLSTERSAMANVDYNSASKHASSNSLDSDSKSSSLNSKQGVDTMVNQIYFISI